MWLFAKRNVFACFLLLVASIVEAVSLSGKVINPDGSPKPGVVVTLAATGVAATTGSDGTWALSGSTHAIGVVPGQANSPTTHLLLRQRGSLNLAYSGYDFSGRPLTFSACPPTKSAAGQANRLSKALPDTLVYGWNGYVILRDTLSDLEQSGIVRRFDTTWNAAIVYGYLTDPRDGQVYRTVKIGPQTWMAENLNFVPQSDSSWAYGNSPDSALKYGRLYRWAAVLGLADSCNRAVCSTLVKKPHRGICPVGWHVPKAAEWDSLGAFAGRRGGRTGLNLKSKFGWKFYLYGTPVDSFGFRGLPGGARDVLLYTDGILRNFISAGTSGQWWNATEQLAYSAYSNVTGYQSPDLIHGAGDKSMSYSLRCVRDSL